MSGTGFSGRFYEKGGKTFSLFAGKIKKLQPECKGKKLDVAIHLDHLVVCKNIKTKMHLQEYDGVALAIFGIEMDCRVVTQDTMVVFGFASDSRPTMALKLRCFRNPELVISEINSKIAVSPSLYV